MTDLLSLAGAAAALELLVRATLLIGGAWVAAAALRAAGLPAAARHIAWLLGIAALLALPLVWWLAPALLLPVLPETAAAPAAAPLPALASSASPSPLAGQWIGLLMPVYALGAALLLLRIAIARRILARMWREADPVTESAWQDLLCALSLEMHLPRKVALRIASGPAMPMTWGTLDPKILLPAESRSWSPDRRRLVLLHELAHVARRDSLSRSIASLACALYWFHPGAWFAARRMFMEQEHAADDRVLAAGGSARAYAKSLLHLAAPAGGGFRPAHAAGMAGMYQMERRLVSIINPARRDRPTPAFLSSSALLASLATLVVAAGVPVAFASDPLHPPGLRPAGIVPDEVAKVPGARDGVPGSGGPREGTGSGRQAGSGAVEQPGQAQSRAYAASVPEIAPLRSGPATRAGAEPPTQAARPGDPAGPLSRMRAETFTLSPAASAPEGRAGALPSLGLASIDRSASPAPIVDVPRRFPATAVERPRPESSERRTRFVLEVVRGVPIEL